MPDWEDHTKSSMTYVYDTLSKTLVLGPWALGNMETAHQHLVSHMANPRECIGGSIKSNGTMEHKSTRKLEQRDMAGTPQARLRPCINATNGSMWDL